MSIFPNLPRAPIRRAFVAGLAVLAVLVSAACAGMGAPARDAPSRVQAADDWLVKSVAKIDADFLTVKAADPAKAAELEYVFGADLAMLKDAVTAYRQVATDSPARADGMWPEAWGTIVQVAGVVGPMAVKALAGGGL